MNLRLNLALAAALTLVSSLMIAASWPNEMPLSNRSPLAAASISGWPDPEAVSGEVVLKCLEKSDAADLCTEDVLAKEYPISTAAEGGFKVTDVEWAALARACKVLGDIMPGAQQGCSRHLGELAVAHLTSQQPADTFGGERFSEAVKQAMGRLLVQSESVCSMPGADRGVCLDQVFSSLPNPAYSDNDSVEKVCSWLPQDRGMCQVRVSSIMRESN